MAISRTWATPITIGIFAIMSVTGILMFFHLNTGLNKPLHQWAGLFMVAGVALHVVVNWRAFQNYFSSVLALSLIGLSLLILAGSFFLAGGNAGGGSPGAMAINAIAEAPLSSVAPLTGKPVDKLLADLATAGIALPGPEASIKSATAGDRSLQGKALAVLFGRRRGAD